VDWEAIGAIGEIVGAAAVVASLAYLSIQVRGSSEILKRTEQATRTQNSQATVQNFDRWRDMILMPGGAEIWSRGINDLSTLDSNEKIRFNMIASALIWSVWYMYQTQKNEGIVPEVNAHVWQDIFKHPGYREWLMVHRRLHTDDFGDFLDEVREAVGDERYESGESSSITAGTY
jgi:hypothetical protein